MRWIGQHIWNFISRFRTTVYIENLETSSEENVLVVDSDGKITKNTTLGGSDLTITNATDNRVVTSTGGTGLNAEATFTYNGDFNILDISSSLSGSLPFVSLTNSHAGAAGPAIQFIKSANGAADDILGKVTFLGDDDGGNTQTYAELKATIKDAAAGSEAGMLEMQVAEYDGTVTTGLLLDGDTNANGEIDVTIGAGVGSLATIAGGLRISGDQIALSGSSTQSSRVIFSEDTDNGSNSTTLEGAAAMGSNRTITLPDATGTVALTQKTIVVDRASYWSSDTGSNPYYIPFDYFTESTSLTTASYRNFHVAPYDGRVVSIASFHQSSSTRTSTIEMYIDGDDSDLVADQRGSDLSSGSHGQKFQVDCPADWTFSKGEALAFRRTDNAATYGATMTIVFEYDITT